MKFQYQVFSSNIISINFELLYKEKVKLICYYGYQIKHNEIKNNI